MSENVQITPGTGDVVAADQVNDITLGIAKVQYIKIMDGTITGTNKAGVSAFGLEVDGSGVTQPISAISLPLPSGAATSANQTSEISYLSTIATNTTNAGTPTVSGTVIVTQSVAANLNATVTGSVATVPPSNASTNITEVDGSAISLGQKASANSIPVVIASDQSPVVVTGTITTSPNVNVHDGSGNAISSTSGSLNVDVTNTVPVSQSGTWNITNITGTISLPTGASTAANQATEISSLATIVTNTTGLATSANQTNAAQKTQIVDGSGNVIASTSNALNVDVTNFPAIQPVSGTITANQGTPNTLANAWPTKLTDGTNTVAVGANGNLIVSGLSAVGTIPTLNPVSIAGVDNGGLKRALLTDTSGRLGVDLYDGLGNAINSQSISGSQYLNVTLASSGTTGSAVPIRTLQIGGSDGTNLRTIATDTSGHVLVTSTAAALPTAAGVGQTKIATTGVAVQLANNALVNGVVLSANISNSANIIIGGSGVLNVFDGTGNGYILAPGSSVGVAVSNTNELYINGTSGDVVSFVGS